MRFFFSILSDPREKNQFRNSKKRRWPRASNTFHPRHRLSFDALNNIEEFDFLPLILAHVAVECLRCIVCKAHT